MAFTVELLEPESPDLLSWVFKKFPRNAGLICTLYLFPVAAVTNCHRLGGLKQQKFIVFLLWRPEIQHQVVSSVLPYKVIFTLCPLR